MRSIELTLGEPNNYFVKEAFNTLRTNILFSGKQVKVILITSCLGHEGKTTISFEMARSLAEANKKVLLIDADLRKSVTASRYTKERGITGLSQILSGQVEAEQATYRTQILGMDMIFAGPFPPNPAELVGSPAFKELLNDAREQYDYIIVDAPPLGLVIDGAIMATVCDGAVIVINQGSVKYRMAQNVKNQLSKSGCRILGVVLNQAQKGRSSLFGGKGYYEKYSEYYGHDGVPASPSAASPSNVRRPAQTPARSSAPARPAAPQARPADPQARPISQTPPSRSTPPRPQQNPFDKK